MGWAEANWRYLRGELARIRAALANANAGTATAVEPTPIAADLVEPAPAITRLCRLFALSAFERDVVLVCVGVELDPQIAALCAKAGAGLHRPAPTLVLSAFAGGHVAAFAPSAPLRKHRIVELADGPPLFAAPLELDPRVLHFLLGIDEIDARLAPTVTELCSTDDDLVTRSRAAEIERAATAMDRASSLVVLLTDSSIEERRAVAMAICCGRGMRLFRVRAHDLPLEPIARHAYRARWHREARLLDAALLIEVDSDGAPELLRNTIAFVEELEGPVVVSAREPIPLGRTDCVGVELRAQASATRLEHWRHALGPSASALDGELDHIAAQFVLPPSAIRRASLAIEGGAPAARLWDACRQESRNRLDDLARRIEPVATWNDLVLPDDVIKALRSISSHLRYRFQVYERWGFGSRTGRGLGSGALFAGASGTGKTLAAEVLAREARLDLYHVDLSQVVNKYVGETEKNLRRVFDAAESGGALLLFDEADALFGKRGDVDRGTDRYANLEVSYLLQRMETYRGLAILTTNQREALDSAFLRRLRFVVSFPFPDLEQRIGLWLRAFPQAAPVGAVDVRKLARLKLPGGHIRNIAVQAAFVAAELGEAISMTHLLDAARDEFAKIERPFPEGDVAGWLS
jgi:hypothetical protein